MNDHIRNTYFRGGNKLIPIYSEHIRNTTNTVTLNKTVDDLTRYWNKTIPCGPTYCPMDELVEMPVFDRYNSRIGTFCTFVETSGNINNFGILLDPYICETWHLPHNTTFPVETNNITMVKDTITLDKALNELKEYWQQKRQNK